MNIVGLPPKFWVVTQPSPVSIFTDICFACDFAGFASQVRGGLSEEHIVGIFAGEEQAAEQARALLAARPPIGPNDEHDPNALYHASPWSDWFAGQHPIRGVWICNRATGQQVKLEPPSE